MCHRLLLPLLYYANCTGILCNDNKSNESNLNNLVHYSEFFCKESIRASVVGNNNI